MTAAGCAAPESSDTNDLARLALLDVSTAISLVNDDKSCGFESPSAIASQKIVGEPGADGKVVRTVKDCVVELKDKSEKYPFFKCDKDAGVARGKVKFSGSRTLVGRITRDPGKPVIPSSSDALSIVVDSAQFDGFEVIRKDKAGSVSLSGGTVTATTKIALAAGKADGLCQAPTPNARLQDVRLSDVELRFINLLGEKSYLVSTGLLQATNGKVDGVENQLQGTLVFDGKQHEIPAAGAQPQFDTEYTKAKFDSTFACPAGDVQLPVSYACADINESIATNAARTSFLALIDLVNLIENDTTCGFASDAVKNAKVVSGLPGSEGTITYTATRCKISIPKTLVVGKDCRGIGDTVSGNATITARKVQRGTITDDPNTPFLPLSDAPITFEIMESELDNFAVNSGDRLVHVASGSLTGEMVPRVARSTNFGFCQVPTRTAELNRVRLSNANIRISTPSGTVDASVEDSKLFAVSGDWKGKENVLWGEISTNNKKFLLPINMENAAFDTAYDPETHAERWQCDPALAKPVSYECSTELPVPETVARLSVGMFGALTQYLEKDTECGFSNQSVKTAAGATSSVGDVGTTTFSVASCRKVFGTPTVISQDCNGKKVSVKGTVVYRATKKMVGYNTGYLPRQVIPTRRDAITFDMAIDFDDVLYTDASPQGAVSLSIDGATLSGTASPRLALDTSSNTCSKPTPITTFSNLTYQQPTNLTIGFPGLNYKTNVQAMNVAAQSGSKDGVVNAISGSLTLNGEAYRFPINGSSALDPNYEPARFDASFACEPNLKLAESDAQCDFKGEIALQTARYLPMVVESIAKVVSADTNCGLNIADGRLEPDVSSIGGGLVAGVWTAPHNGNGFCNYARTRLTPVDVDCRGRRLIAEGTINVQANLTIRGRLANERGTRYVNPTRPDAPSDYTFSVPTINNLTISEFEQNGDPIQSIFIQRGALNVSFNPIMADREGAEFAYLRATPVNRFKRILLTGTTPITLGIGGMTLKATLSDASISGFSGAHNGESNKVTGSLTIDGRRFSEMEINAPLDPAYNQSVFDSRYSCEGPIVPLTFR